MRAKTVFHTVTTIIAIALLSVTINAHGAEKLRLLTWDYYAPKDIIAEFTEQTGIGVAVTVSNNEDMLARLQAGGGFDLAQPSQDRIANAQREFGIYKPLNLAKINTDLFTPSMLAVTKKHTTIGDEVYGVPHIWGTTGLIVNTDMAKDIRGFNDLCKPELAGKISYRLKRPLLIGFAFAMGMDPFAAYENTESYQAILNTVQAKLIECQSNVEAYWTEPRELLNFFRSGEVVAAMGWDSIGWRLHAENPAIRYFAPASGALGWIDTFAIPARGENDEAAYQWINFIIQPEIAARITNASQHFTTSKDASQYIDVELKKRFGESFSPTAINKIHWYPPVFAEQEVLEHQVLERIRNTEPE